MNVYKQLFACYNEDSKESNKNLLWKDWLFEQRKITGKWVLTQNNDNNNNIDNNNDIKEVEINLNAK